MNNKEILRGYNTHLDENNNDLTEILSVIQNLPEASSNEEKGEELMVYSLNEHIIGTWVDGRPLYQKTLYFTSGWKIGGEIAMPHGIENVDDIWLESALWRRSDDTRQNIPNEHSMVGAWGSGLYDIKPDTFTLYMGTLNNSFTIKYIYITFNYTKTTDIATV